MSKDLSCGFIVATPQGWLIGHSTGNKHWDFPKGCREEHETNAQAAIREALEEFNLDLSYLLIEDAHDIETFGPASYSKDKDLVLFKVNVEDVDLSKLKCTSMVDRGTYQFPEIDAYQVVEPSQAMSMLSKSMVAWLTKNASDLLAQHQEQVK
jgi:8-oxo-dGTP pyrophosphatase MutT (NUDIX family)